MPRSGRRQGGTDRRTPGIRVVPRATNLQTAAVLHLGRITPRLSPRHREGSTRSCPASKIDRERGDASRSRRGWRRRHTRNICRHIARMGGSGPGGLQLRSQDMRCEVGVGPEVGENPWNPRTQTKCWMQSIRSCRPSGTTCLGPKWHCNVQLRFGSSDLPVAPTPIYTSNRSAHSSSRFSRCMSSSYTTSATGSGHVRHGRFGRRASAPNG